MSLGGIKCCVLPDTFTAYWLALRKVLWCWKGEDTPLTLAFPDCRVGVFFFACILPFVLTLFAFHAMNRAAQ